MPIKNLLKHLQISQWIINSINSGTLKPGDKLPSEHTLSEQFETSRQTVRHATEELVQRGLLVRQRGSGTFICNTAFQSGFAPKRIGVITTRDDYTFPGVLRGIEEVLAPQGYSVSVGITHNRHTEETSCLQRFLEDNICGLIIEGTKSAFPSPNLQLFEELRSRGTPIVFFNGYYREFSQCGVFQDDVSAARILTEHLLNNGHQHFSAILKADDLQGLKRFEGMSLAFTFANISLDDQRILWYTTEDLSDFFSGEMDDYILKRIGNSTALICYNDKIAADLCELLKRHGKSVPEDISVISFDNSSIAADPAYGFTSAIYPSTEIGTTAANLLLRSLRDSSLREHISLPPDICYRSSVRNLWEEET